jgi:hypothetical protein
VYSLITFSLGKAIHALSSLKRQKFTSAKNGNLLIIDIEFGHPFHDAQIVTHQCFLCVKLLISRPVVVLHLVILVEVLARFVQIEVEMSQYQVYENL